MAEIADIIEGLAKTIWLSEFERAFSRTPTDPWENQAEAIKNGHRLTARKIMEAGFVKSRGMVIEECAKVLDDCAQDWHRIRDPGMAANARSYARKLRSLILPEAA